MKPFTDLLAEQERLSLLLREKNVPQNIETYATIFACIAMHRRGEYKEALEHMIKHMKEIAFKNGITV